MITDLEELVDKKLVTKVQYEEKTKISNDKIYDN